MKTNELDSCFVQSKEQFEAALKAAAVDVKHAHLANMKPGNEGVIYVPYIPMQIVETDEEREARIKRKRAGKSYAKVKLSNDNPHYRHKRGEIVDKDLTNKRYCLEIETVNTCTKNGSYTLIGVVYPRGYKKIWFNEDELSNFETYDENGELI